MTNPATTDAAEVLWTPDPERAAGTAIADFTRWLGEHRGVKLDELDYRALHEWSIRDLDGFWSAAAEYLGVIFRDPPTATLGSRDMPGAQWFPGSTLNYAEHALTPGPGGRTRTSRCCSRGRTGRAHRHPRRAARQVGRARAGLVAAGVGRGDRVVALAPNSVETLVAFLAAASLGAIWSSCSPDFGPRAVRDRFAQIEPSVLLAVDGYCYGGKRFDIRRTVSALQRAAADRAHHGAGGLPGPGRAAGRHGAVGRVHRRTAGRWSSNRSRSTTRSGCCTPRAPPGCPRASCTGTAGSCWST